MKTILHLGVGNFHRAHQAAYTHAANALGGEIWRIIGVSLRSPGIRDALADQEFDYTLAIKDADGRAYEKITCISDILFAPEANEEVLSAIAIADLITLTITEKGYCLTGDGRLDLQHAGIAHDLAGGASTAIGLLARGLARRNSGLAILSCDNLSANGTMLEGAVRDFATAANLPLPDGLEFPSTMVDRITPATTDQLRDEVLRETGFADAAPVETEEFTEWVIEEFSHPRPDWSQVGVDFVADVAPFELRKLRLLNGAHSTLAYAGVVAGHDFVHQAIADPHLRDLASGVMAEASETLPDGIETKAYIAALLERFTNPALHHKLRQIAMDGSQKLPVRLMGSIRDRQALGLSSPSLWAGVEAWIAFVQAETEAGRALDDPLAEALAQDARAGNATARLLARLGG